MKKTLTILIGLAVIIATALWLNSKNIIDVVNNNDANSQVSITKPELAQIESLASQQQFKPTIAKAGSAPSADHDIIAFANEDNEQGESPFAQSELAEEVLKASGKLRENLRGEVYLEIDNDHIASLDKGDMLKLDIPFFDMYQDVAVESTRLDHRGNKTIIASFPMNDETYNTTITINERAIFGHIETPHGIYSLAGNGQYAWMAEAKDLVHGAIPDQIGGNSYDGSADPQPVSEPKPMNIKGK